MNSSVLLAELHGFLHRRRIQPEGLTAAPMVAAMLDWYRLVPVGLGSTATGDDVLLYRSGGWSEGCATGYKLSLLRRVTDPGSAGKVEWFAGITLLFDPARFAQLPPVSTLSTDWPTLEAFLHAIESSPAYRAAGDGAPMGVLVESGGLR